MFDIAAEIEKQTDAYLARYGIGTIDRESPLYLRLKVCDVCGYRRCHCHDEPVERVRIDNHDGLPV